MSYIGENEDEWAAGQRNKAKKLAAKKRNMKRKHSINITMSGGNCPVQIEGTVGKSKVPFYFRARHDKWTLGVGPDPVSSPIWTDGGGYEDAGWMHIEIATAILKVSLAKYMKESMV